MSMEPPARQAPSSRHDARYGTGCERNSSAILAWSATSAALGGPLGIGGERCLAKLHDERQQYGDRQRHTQSHSHACRGTRWTDVCFLRWDCLWVCRLANDAHVRPRWDHLYPHPPWESSHHRPPHLWVVYIHAKSSPSWPSGRAFCADVRHLPSDGQIRQHYSVWRIEHWHTDPHARQRQHRPRHLGPAGCHLWCRCAWEHLDQHEYHADRWRGVTR